MSMCTQMTYESKLGLITGDKARRGRDRIKRSGEEGRGEEGGKN